MFVNYLGGTNVLIPTASSNDAAVNEESLVVSAKNGDEQAFEILAKSYKRVLDFHINHLDKNPSNYDDLFQEGLIGLFKAVRSYDGKIASFSTYASSCIKNSIISGVRKNATQTAKTVITDEISQSGEETSPSAEAVHLDSIRAQMLYNRVYESLSAYEKTVFEMYLSDISYESIAFVTGKSVKSISNAVFRIREKLKKIIGTADDLK
ncbi:MAG: sigma-70 family RNA polymerase sigma factor [Clostridia bacterium]|nr:sigma-70 family RNA polymerase sigma factor [Clostridia bacterium]